MIAGLVFLGIAIVLAIAMVTDFLYDHWIVWAAPAAIALAPRVALVRPPAPPHGVLRPQVNALTARGTVPVRDCRLERRRELLHGTSGIVSVGPRAVAA